MKDFHIITFASHFQERDKQWLWRAVRRQILTHLRNFLVAWTSQWKNSFHRWRILYYRGYLRIMCLPLGKNVAEKIKKWKDGYARWPCTSFLAQGFTLALYMHKFIITPSQFDFFFFDRKQRNRSITGLLFSLRVSETMYRYRGSVYALDLPK